MCQCPCARCKDLTATARARTEAAQAWDEFKDVRDGGKAMAGARLWHGL